MSHIFVPQCAVLLIICLSFLGCGEANTTPQNAYEGDMPGECNNGADDDRDGAYDCDDEDCAGAPVCLMVPAIDAGSGDPVDSGGSAGSGGSTGAGGSAGPGGTGGIGGSGGFGDNDNDNRCLSDEAFLESQVWSQVIAERCVGCHQQGGLAQFTDMVLLPDTSPGWQTHNLAQINSVTTRMHDGIPLILLKPTGRHPDGHAGGQLLIEGSDEYNRLNELVGRILDEINDCGRPLTPLPDSEDACETLEPGRRLLRRLSHVEYQRTIQDLLNVNIDAKGAFVADTIDHGFENHPSGSM